MINVKPLKKGDFAMLNPHHTQTQHEANAEYESELMKGERSFSFWSGDVIIACMGAHEVWHGRRMIWAVMGVETSKHMRQLTILARSLLKQFHCRRSEIYVNADFKQGIRWARMVGFKLETLEPMEGFFPEGGSAYMFSMMGD